MKKIRSVLLILIAFISMGILASCGSTAKIEVVNISSMRTRIGVTILVEDEKSLITSSSIIARLYDSDDDLESSVTFDALEEEEQTKEFTDLEENTSYKLVLTATIDGKKKTIKKQTVKTSTVGESYDNPIHITNETEFENITYDNDAYFVLDADLNFADAETNEPGSLAKLFDATTKFEGHFDGQNHSIKNIAGTYTDTYVGIFGYIAAGAEVKNLVIDNVSYTSTKGSYVYIGTVAGCNEGTISNVHVSNIVFDHKGTGTSQEFVGGMVAVNTGIIKDSDVTTASFDLRSRYQSVVGGFIGENGGIAQTVVATAYVDNCFAKAVTITTNFETVRTVSEDEDEEYLQYTGGFVGETRIDITNSYCEAEITSTVSYYAGSILKLFEVDLGGFAGRAINGCKLTNIASVATLSLNNKDAYETYVGTLIGSSYDTIITNAFSILKGTNSIISTADYNDTMKDDEGNWNSGVNQDIVDMFAVNFDVIGKDGETLINNPVKKSENVVFVLLATASIEDDTEDSTGHLKMTTISAGAYDIETFSGAVKTFITEALA